MNTITNVGLQADLHQNIRSVESVTYILTMVAVVIFLVCVGFFYFRKVKTQALIQTRFFNKEIFMNNRFLFEKFAEKDTLEPRHFFALGHDRQFMEHLWRKEVGYYEKLVNLIQTLKLLRFLKWGSAMFLVFCSVLSYLLMTGVVIGHN